MHTFNFTSNIFESVKVFFVRGNCFVTKAKVRNTDAYICIWSILF